MKHVSRSSLMIALCMTLAVSLVFPFSVKAELDELDSDTVLGLRRVELKDGITVDITVGESVLLYWNDTEGILRSPLHFLNSDYPVFITLPNGDKMFAPGERIPSQGPPYDPEREERMQKAEERRRKDEEREAEKKLKRLGIDTILSYQPFGPFLSSGYPGTEQLIQSELGRPGIPLLAVVITGLKPGSATWDLNGDNPLFIELSSKKENFKFTLSVVEALPEPEPEPEKPTQIVKDDWLAAEAINAGVKLVWRSVPDFIGWRLYRSVNPDEEGVFIANFSAECSEFVDVNVRPEETYYYSLWQVMPEADIHEDLQEEDLPEEAIPIVGKTQVETLGEVLGEELSSDEKSFILMAIGSPYMNVNGINREIDPGRGTVPLILEGSTVVPIRAIVESMGGKVGWDAVTGEISIDYRNRSVRMTPEQKSSENGGQARTDGALTTINERAMSPIRFVVENLGCAVEWLEGTKQIVIVY